MAVRLGLLMALMATTAFVYRSVAGFAFVSLDDPLYVTQNEWVLRGLDAESMAWALTGSVGANWLPLTFFSHMVDVELYGLDPGGHHLSNLVLHMASVGVLFGVLVSMTARTGRAAMVAALFALHPMHIESVAWITERKDVLSGLFCFLTLAAWLGYARHGGALRYALAALLLAMGLMSKAMLVTVPFVLLLLDLWPLGRLRPGSGSSAVAWLAGKGAAERPGRYRQRPPSALLWEKLPLLALGLLAAAATFAVQQQGGAMIVAGGVPLPERLANAVYSLARYLELAVWPADLTIQRPHPSLPEEGGRGLSLLQVGGAALLLIAAGTAAVRAGRAALVGACWFVGMLIPVIGIVQVGPQAMADRYSYLPFVGLYVAVVWTVSERVARSSAGMRRAVVVAALAVLAACAARTVAHLPHWRDSIPLFEHAIEADPGNHAARYALSRAYRIQDRVPEAIEQIRIVLAARPESSRANNAMGSLLRTTGETDTAILHLERAIEAQPGLALAYRNLGLVYRDRGEAVASERAYRRALELDPDARRTPLQLARLLRDQGRIGEAAELYRRVLASSPDSVQALHGLAIALADQGEVAQAIGYYRKLVEIQPERREFRDQLRALEAESSVRSSDDARSNR